MKTIAALALFALSLSPALAAAPKSPFATAIRVNDGAISFYEITQRRRFLQVLRTPGDLQKKAEDALIDDRLRLQAGAAAGIKTDPAAVQLAMAKFAARAKLTTDQFVADLARAGVVKQTFRDFVRAGLVWREVVRKRFVPRAAISKRDVDIALAQAGAKSDTAVLLSEIILAPSPGKAAETRALAQKLSNTIRGEKAFAAAAARYSAAPTAPFGGKLDWVKLRNLPPALAPILLKLDPGDVSAPVPVGPGVAVFLLRGLREGARIPAPVVTEDYAIMRLPGGRSAANLATARRIASRVDTCDDLYGVTRKMPAGTLSRQSLPVAKIPTKVALQLARLDPNEISTALSGRDGKALTLLMLCSRSAKLPPDARATMRKSLLNQRLAAYAQSYLAELRANAIIIRK